MPLNSFAREILSRLGLVINQINPNTWRLIVSMQVLWMEVFDGKQPLTMDEFLYYYKPSEINQSLGFYQFLARGSNCKFVKSLPMFDRKWKTEFFFVFEFRAGNPVEVGRDPFPPYTGEMGNLRVESMSLFDYLFNFFCCTCLTFSSSSSASSSSSSSFIFIFYFFLTTVRQPALSKFHLDCI